MSFDYESDYERLQVENAKLRDEIAQWRSLAMNQERIIAELRAKLDAVPVEAIRVALMEGNTDFDAQWNAEEAVEAWLKELGVWSGQVHEPEVQPEH